MRIEKTPFELRQWQRLNHLKEEKNIVEKGTPRSLGTPIMAIHDMRIEAMEKYLGVKK